MKAGGDPGNSVSLNDANNSINRKCLVKPHEGGNICGVFLLLCIFSGVGVVCWFGFSFSSPLSSLEKGGTLLGLKY